MYSSLINGIAKAFIKEEPGVLLVVNPDRFLYRKDVQIELEACGIRVIVEKALEQRIAYELRNSEFKDIKHVLVRGSREHFPEDMRLSCPFHQFHIRDYIQGYHIPLVVSQTLPVLDYLQTHPQIDTLNLASTETYIREHAIPQVEKTFDLDKFSQGVNDSINREEIDWKQVIELVSDGINKSLESNSYEQLSGLLHKVNRAFQQELKGNYTTYINSNPIHKPKVVTRIQDHIHLNSKRNKTALVVVDGMSYWQYQLLKDLLYDESRKISEDYTYAWIPSTTEYSRQGIFKGDIPKTTYIQNPKNEEKLFVEYWSDKGIPGHEIGYYHGGKIPGIGQYRKLAVVLNALDEKMHAAQDLKDLRSLTLNWKERGELQSIIHKLLESGFVVYLTSDHGNIQATSWRELKSAEKVGTQKTGSRSKRHVTYTEKWLSDKLIRENHELDELVIVQDTSVVFKDIKSFSNKNTLVSHGGAHFLEVIVPFIRIEHAN